MRVIATGFDPMKPEGELFTLTWYPETDGELMAASDRCSASDRIDTTGRVFFAMAMPTELAGVLPASPAPSPTRGPAPA